MIAFSASRTRMLQLASMVAKDVSDTLQLFMGILALLTYLYEIPAGACLGYLILQTLCLILQISSCNPGFTRSILRICTEGEVQCHPSSHL